MTEYIIRAMILDEPDRSDPENKLVVLGLKVQEVSFVPRTTVIENEGESTQTIRLVRDDGQKDFAWGCKVTVPRLEDARPLERALAALALCLLKYPPPEPVRLAIQEALSKPGLDAEWTPWFELGVGTAPELLPIV